MAAAVPLHPAPTRVGVPHGRRASGVVSSPMGRASWVVGLSLATSATAHLEGGGLLPGWHGTVLLMVCSCLLWWASTWLAGSRAGLLLVLVLGQLAGHVCYQVGTIPSLPATGPSGATMPTTTAAMGTTMPDMSGMGASPASPASTGFIAHLHRLLDMSSMTGASMPGMPGRHAVAAMWLCHLVAVVVCAALLLALQLPATVRSWLGRFAPSHLVLVMTQGARVACVWRRCTPRWALAPPPPLRGPPTMA